MKTYILYHAHCTDGFGAAWAASQFLGPPAEFRHYIPVSYGKPMPEIEDGSRVFILDFSYPRAQLEALAKRVDELVVIDHHQTAQADLGGCPFARFDMSRSGAVLTWEYFHASKPVPGLLQYVQDRDLWRFELPYSREVSAALRLEPLDLDVWSDLMQRPIERLANDGVVALKLTQQSVKSMAKGARLATFARDGSSIEFGPIMRLEDASRQDWVSPHLVCAPTANATVFFSEVGEQLLDDFPTAPMAAYYFDRGDGKRQWGFRSREYFDCSVIAKAFDGGGHKCAAGFTEEAP